MNRSMARALLQDALEQVLDNRIFRLLLIVVLGLVAPTFLVGFREEDVRVLWGWQQLAYEDIYGWLGRSPVSADDLQASAIQFYQGLVVDSLCGNIGMVFCVAATAFFVPRMLEKGSADVLFSKPLSRVTLLVARYVSGILFVGILAFALVIGMYLGFLIVSGYSDTGLLWGGFTLVYLFAIVHGVATVAGVVTRSAVASTLIAIVFFVGTGCVHTAWRIRAYIQESEETKKFREMVQADDSGAPLPAVLDENPGTFARMALLALDTLHYTLPKTSDADIITRRLRRAVEGQDVVLEDEVARLSIPRYPEGFELVGGDLPPPTRGRARVDLADRPLAWRLPGEGGSDRARIEVSRRSRLVEREGADGGARARPKRISAAAAAEERVERARREELLDSEVSERKLTVDNVPVVVVGWYEDLPQGRRARQVAVVSAGDWLVEVDESADPEWTDAAARGKHLDAFVSEFQVARATEFGNASNWYERRFAGDAPLPYNLWFSIGTSLAFTALVLGAAAWKLSRIDF